MSGDKRGSPPKWRSPATELRYAKAELKKVREESIRNGKLFSAERERAKQAIADRDEWKARFDLLLSKIQVCMAGGDDAD